MNELSTLDKARLLIRVATGEEYGDGYTVTDLTVGYAEPGYGNDESVVVFGNWNPKRFPREGEPALTKAETIGPRLAEALERAGVECEWLDEWARCDECYRAMRTQADSYSWTMYGAWVDDYGYVCADCMRRDPESYLTDYVNNPRNAITWCEAKELDPLGFVKWEPGDPHDYENGFHPGQNDDPETILAQILDHQPLAEVVFFIDSVGQFDVHFSAYVRFGEEEETDD